MIRLAHLINPVRVPETSDLFVAQPVTFRSLEIARAFCAGRVHVDQLAAVYPEDTSFVPPHLHLTRPLERSVLDCGSFAIPRKLPLVADLLERLLESSDAEYLIYTNVDIALMPPFYEWVAQAIASGIDAMTITRRTIPKTWTSPAQIVEMFADPGLPHPGNDCFVFSRAACEKFDVAQVCIGARFVVPALGGNVVCHARNYQHFGDRHLTFHIGDDRTWKEDRFADYAEFNRAESGKALRNLHAQGLLKLEARFMRTWLLRCAPDLLPPEDAAAQDARSNS